MNLAVLLIAVEEQEVEVIWSWLKETGRAKLVTVYFRH